MKFVKIAVLAFALVTLNANAAVKAGSLGKALRGSCAVDGVNFYEASLGTFDLEPTADEVCPGVTLSVSKYFPGETDIYLEYQNRNGGVPDISNGHSFFMF